MKDFETEIALYKQLLPELLATSEGKFAVIKNQRLLGIFATHSEGYRAGLDAFGVVPFLLRHITSKPRVIRMYGLPLSLKRVRS